MTKNKKIKYIKIKEEQTKRWKNLEYRLDIIKKLRESMKGNQNAKGKKMPPRSAESKRRIKEWNIKHPNKKYNNTKIEQKIAAELTLRKIDFQQNIGLKNIANVDFYLSEYNIVIECDGCYYHNCLIHHPNSYKETRKADERKTSLLIENGYKVYRFWGHEINESTKRCIDQLNIKKELD